MAPFSHLLAEIQPKYRACFLDMYPGNPKNRTGISGLGSGGSAVPSISFTAATAPGISMQLCSHEYSATTALSVVPTTQV